MLQVLMFLPKAYTTYINVYAYVFFFFSRLNHMAYFQISFFMPVCKQRFAGLHVCLCVLCVCGWVGVWWHCVKCRLFTLYCLASENASTANSAAMGITLPPCIASPLLKYMCIPLYLYINQCISHHSLFSNNQQ